MIEGLMITFVKTFFMNLCITYSYIKIKDYKNLNKENIIKILLLNILICIGYSILYENICLYIRPIFMNFICYAIHLLGFSILINDLDRSFYIVMLMSMCFPFAAFFIASIISFYITRFQIFGNIINTVIEYLLIGIIQFGVIYNFFKIKRFKDGFLFVKDRNLSKYINALSIILSILIVIFIIYTTSQNRLRSNVTFAFIVLAVVLIIYLIKRSINLNYKSKMKDRTVEYLNEQLQEKDKIIENLKTDLDKTLTINHKYNHRISAMERAIVKAKFNEEFAEENNEIINLVKELAKDYKNETFETESKLPKTNVFSIDNILEYMANKANNDNIEFQVDVKCNIKDLITNIVNQSKLATLLADHINDAIIAINYSGNELRKILVVFDKIDDIYEIKIYDTGIEFEIETLLKLGKEQVTTHKDSGGTGIGFMTTFETLKESKGSLIIEEDNSEDYSKAIIIKFDNKCEYKIHSYRADEIREQNKNSNIIIEKI